MQAAYYSGEPLANRVLRCTLPDRRIERITTDAEGKARLSFDTTGIVRKPNRFSPPPSTGKTLPKSESLTLARLGFTITAKPSQPVVIAGKPFDLDSSTTLGADGKPAGRCSKIEVLRMENRRPAASLTLLPWPQAAVARRGSQGVRTGCQNRCRHRQGPGCPQSGKGWNLHASRHRTDPLRTTDFQ